MGIHLRSDCWCSLRESSLRVSLSFGCLEDNEGVGLAPSTSRAAFAFVAELKGVQCMGDEDPKFFFARIFRLEIPMRAVGIEKSESEIVEIILLQLPERYDVVKTVTLADPQLTRSRLENIIRSAYSQRKVHAKQGPAAAAPAAPPNPHALVVGRGFEAGAGGGGGGQRRDDSMVLRGGGMPRQLQQQQQHWSRGGGMLRQQQQQ